MKRMWMKRVPLFILIASVVIVLSGGAVMLLWNAILPVTLHTGMITFWQAAGLLVLARLLFGGFRGRGHGNWHWKRRMFARWNQMTPEEREQMRSNMHYCCSPRNWKNKSTQASGFAPEQTA